jgi:all-trans-retinol 13,14-reductase
LRNELYQNKVSDYDIIIIGGGLGGLECGYILARKGYSVCVLEKNPQIGGCLQTFRRGRTTFDTGFHYVGGLDEGQSLHRLFRYFGLLDLPWRKMDENGFAEIILHGKSYFLASGHERFVDTLSREFPDQRRQIATYAAFLKQVGDNIMNRFSSESGDAFTDGLFERSAYEFLQETTGNSLLRDVLSGASLTMELNPETLPLYMFAQINNSFIQSAWRLEGGGGQIAESLAESIRKMGGVVHTNAAVTGLTVKDGKISGVRFCGEEARGKYVISDLHPASTIALLPETAFRKAYRNRIMQLPNTFGVFTTHLQLKENTVPYLNRNIFLYRGQSPWYVATQRADDTEVALITFQTPKAGTAYTDNIDILTPMRWQEVAQWADTSAGRRGEEYRDFKLKKAEECIALAEKRLPELRGQIAQIYTSTPLSYRDYNGTREGSAYGIRKDCRHIIYTVLTPQTQIRNLLLTGQNLNLHGVLGVSMTAFFTCARITGMETLLNELNR